MNSNSDIPQKADVIVALEKILSELDEKQLVLPALKIVEALQVLDSTDTEDQSTDRAEQQQGEIHRREHVTEVENELHAGLPTKHVER